MVLGEGAADGPEFTFGWGPMRFWLDDADDVTVGWGEGGGSGSIDRVGAVRFLVPSTPGWLVMAT